jgi:hypothetical protein
MAVTIPMDVVRNILDYDNRFVFRGKEIIQINKIDKNDERYNILSSIPKVKCIDGGDYWLDLPIANTKRQYIMQYECNFRRSYFYGSLLDFDVNIEDDEADEPYEEILYCYSIPKNNV